MVSGGHENCPENYGFNAIPLRVPEPGTKVELQFEGLNGKQGGYVSVHPEKAGWRYGFVAVNADGKSIYGEMSADKKENSLLRCLKTRS